MRVCSEAVILLNQFYDCHDWQRSMPLVPIIRQVGESFTLTVAVRDVADPRVADPCARGPQNVFLICVAPAFAPSVAHEVYSYHSFRWRPIKASDAHVKSRNYFVSGASGDTG
eukprot:Selendium_serpulae@DN9391_c0_g1_i1.p2